MDKSKPAKDQIWEEGQSAETKKVFTNCNVCGRQLMDEEEFQIGMCLICASE